MSFDLDEFEDERYEAPAVLRWILRWLALGVLVVGVGGIGLLTILCGASLLF
jgi:hypothetical protein